MCVHVFLSLCPPIFLSHRQRLNPSASFILCTTQHTCSNIYIYSPPPKPSPQYCPTHKHRKISIRKTSLRLKTCIQIAFDPNSKAINSCTAQCLKSSFAYPELSAHRTGINLSLKCDIVLSMTTTVATFQFDAPLLFLFLTEFFLSHVISKEFVKLS